MLLWCVYGTVLAKDTVALDPQHAFKLVRASYIISTLGIVVTAALLGLMIGLIYGDVVCLGYRVDGECYRFRTYVSDSPGECSAMHILRLGFCYHN